MAKVVFYIPTILYCYLLTTLPVYSYENAVDGCFFVTMYGRRRIIHFRENIIYSSKFIFVGHFSHIYTLYAVQKIALAIQSGV